MTSKIGSTGFYKSAPSQLSDLVHEKTTQESNALFNTIVNLQSTSTSHSLPRKKNAQKIKVTKMSQELSSEMIVTQNDPENRCDIKWNNILFYSRRAHIRPETNDINSQETSDPEVAVLAPKSIKASPKKSISKVSYKTIGKKRLREESETALNTLVTKKPKTHPQPIQQKQTETQETEPSQPESTSQTRTEILPLKKRSIKIPKSVSETQNSVLHSSPVQSSEKSVYKESDCIIIPLPYAQDSYENACKYAYSIYLNLNKKPIEAVNILFQLYAASKHIREIIRMGKTEVIQDKQKLLSYQLFLDKLCHLNDVFFSQEDYKNKLKVKIFEFKNNNFNLCQTQNPEGQQMISLYRKNKSDNTPHYDILISVNYKTPFTL